MSAETLYNEALGYFQQGNLEFARRMVERALEECKTLLAHESLRSHELFVDGLVLLSNICSAAASFKEAERLLVTCLGYIRDNFCEGNFHSTCVKNPRPGIITQLRQTALATVAYNRGILRLDEYTHGRADQKREYLPGIEEARDVHLEEAVCYLKNRLGPGRALLADVWHAKGVCHQILGDDEAALLFFQKSMELRQCFCTPDPSCAVSDLELKLVLTMEHVAELYRPHLRHQGREDGLMNAQRIQELLHLITNKRRSILGENHPLVVRSLYQEGVFAFEQGRRRVARELFQQCALRLTSVSPLPLEGQNCVRLGVPTLGQVEHWISVTQI